jgi:hypothetical protein
MLKPTHENSETKEKKMPGSSKWSRFLPWRGAAIVLTIAIGLWTASPASALPTLDRLMSDFGFSKDDVQRVRNGELVKGTAKETSEREIAALMVFLVKAPARTLVSAFETGRGLKNDPRVQKFAEIQGEETTDACKTVVAQLGESEAKRYLDAEPGEKLNLSSSEIAAFRSLKASGGAGQAQVEPEVQRQLLARYRAYRAKGLAGIAPYARATNKETQPADALRRAVEAATGVEKYAPAFHAVLSNYPEGVGDALDQRFFCIRYAMSLRPTFTLRQRLAMSIDDGYVVADREFYVSHDYNEMQAIGGLLPVESGTAVVYINRTTTDQIGGYAASARKVIDRTMMQDQISEIFEKTRTDFQKQ